MNPHATTSDAHFGNGNGLHSRSLLDPILHWSECSQTVSGPTILLPTYGVDIAQETERNEATTKYVAWPSCAWLLLRFFLFHVRHPLCIHSPKLYTQIITWIALIKGLTLGYGNVWECGLQSIIRHPTVNLIWQKTKSHRADSEARTCAAAAAHHKASHGWPWWGGREAGCKRVAKMCTISNV